MFTQTTYNKKITTTLSDKNSTDNTKKLYQYLYNCYGSKIISGQMENAWNNDCNMLNRVYADVKKYPAIMGFDLLNYTISGKSSFNIQTQRAINFWNGKNYNGDKITESKHGIVTFMWHWNVPLMTKDNAFGFYTTNENPNSNTSFRIPYDISTKTWIKDSFEYKQIISDFELIATELLTLQKNDIPILWRPLHEASGNVDYQKDGKAWFWWGCGTKTDSSNIACKESYIALYKLMYNFFQKEKNIHNLIWVWNAQNISWYPDDDYVDLIGYDVYREPKNYINDDSIYQIYSNIPNSKNNKMLALTENEVFPSKESFFSSNNRWSYFMTWNDGNHDNTGKFVTRDTAQGNFWSGNFHNENEHKIDVFNCSDIITLSDIEDFTSYNL